MHILLSFRQSKTWDFIFFFGGSWDTKASKESLISNSVKKQSVIKTNEEMCNSTNKYNRIKIEIKWTVHSIIHLGLTVIEYKEMNKVIN